MNLQMVQTFIEVFTTGLWLLAPLWMPMMGTIWLLGVLVAKREKWHWLDGIYFSMITATTVGYGDIRPVSRISRLLSIFMSLIGLLLTGIVVGIAVKSASFSFEQIYDLEAMKLRVSP